MLFVAGGADKAVVRSAPACAPAGQRLAWTEFARGVDVPPLMIYDLSGGTTSLPLPAFVTRITQ